MTKTDSSSGFTEDQEEVLALMGATLLIIQRIEVLLAGCFLFFYEGREVVDIKKFYEMFADRQHRTLGKLINGMRKIYAIDSRFDAKLARLLENRNLFVHSLTTQYKYDFSTKKGRQNIRRLMKRIFTDASEVQIVLIGAHQTSEEFVAWHAEQQGRDIRTVFPVMGKKARRKEADYRQHFLERFSAKKKAGYR